MFITAVLGAGSSYQFISADFAARARDKFWSRYFFGDFTVTDTAYHEYNSFKTTPPSFIIPAEKFTELENERISYMAYYEHYGTAKILADTSRETNTYKTKDIVISALRGNQLLFDDILSHVNDNKVVVGKNVADYFTGSSILGLSFVNAKGETVETTIYVDDIIDLPIGGFNDTVYINHSYFMNIMETNNNQYTKLKTTGRRRYVTSLTNDKIHIQNLRQNTRYWNKVSNYALGSIFVQCILISLTLMFLVTALIIYIAMDKNRILNYYIWGVKYRAPTRFIWLTGVSFGAGGTVIAWIISVLASARVQRLPDFLFLKGMVPRDIAPSPSWLSAPVFFAGFIFIFIILFITFSGIFKSVTKKLVKHNYTDKIS